MRTLEKGIPRELGTTSWPLTKQTRNSDCGILLAGGFTISMKRVSEFSSTVTFWVKKPKVLAFPTKTPCHLVSLGLGREKACSVPSLSSSQSPPPPLQMFSK